MEYNICKYGSLMAVVVGLLQVAPFVQIQKHRVEWSIIDQLQHGIAT